MTRSLAPVILTTIVAIAAGLGSWKAASDSGSLEPQSAEAGARGELSPAQLLELHWSERAPGDWGLRQAPGSVRAVAVAIEVDAEQDGWRGAEPQSGFLTIDESFQGTRVLALLDDAGEAAPREELPWIAHFAGESPPSLQRVVATGGGSPFSARVTVVAPESSSEFDAMALPDLGPLPGEPLRSATVEQLERFERGRRDFDQHITERDGLGPAFNDHSCFICHLGPASGGFSERRVLHFARSDRGGRPMPERGGPVLQAQGIHPSAVELLPDESDVQSNRITPHLFGSGLVELIPDEALIKWAEQQPDQVRGRVHYVGSLEDDRMRVGRFGWKAQIATLLTFTADAALEELGLTSRLLPAENAPGGDRRVIETYDRVDDPELLAGPDGRDRLDRLVDFQRLLAPPPQTPAVGHPGEAVFEQVGCAECHKPRYSLPRGLGPNSIAPYSDFLLHDMGGEGDGIRTGSAGPQEMRTAPLWGLTGRRFLWHDGGIAHAPFEELLQQAIARHGGQGDGARSAFGELDDEQRALLFDFLRSLGRAPHDLNADGLVDLSDAAALATGLRSESVPEGQRSQVHRGHSREHSQGHSYRDLLDLDGDGLVEAVEWVAFARSMGEAPERQARLARPLR